MDEFQIYEKCPRLRPIILFSKKRYVGERKKTNPRRTTFQPFRIIFSPQDIHVQNLLIFMHYNTWYALHFTL